MLKEEEVLGIYNVSFDLEEIKPLIIKNIDMAHDITNDNSLFFIKNGNGHYGYYHIVYV